MWCCEIVLDVTIKIGNICFSLILEFIHYFNDNFFSKRKLGYTLYFSFNRPFWVAGGYYFFFNFYILFFYWKFLMFTFLFRKMFKERLTLPTKFPIMYEVRKKHILYIFWKYFGSSSGSLMCVLLNINFASFEIAVFGKKGNLQKENLLISFVLVIAWLWGQFGKNSPRSIFPKLPHKAMLFLVNRM